MKVIELSDRTIFVDDIKQIYQEDNYNPIRYTVSTKNGDYRINEEEYYKIKYYLLSLNEPIYEELPKEDKKIKKFKVIKDNTNNLVKLVIDKETKLTISIVEATILDKVNEIIDKVNGDSDDN